MSRSGYIDDCENLGLYRGAVDRALRGKRGQSFLIEMAAALDALPLKRLIHGELVTKEGDVCAIGSVCQKRGIDVSKVDEHDPQAVGKAVGIARAMAAEIEFINDGEWSHENETQEHKWKRVRAWVAENIIIAAAKAAAKGDI